MVSDAMVHNSKPKVKSKFSAVLNDSFVLLSISMNSLLNSIYEVLLRGPHLILLLISVCPLPQVQVHVAADPLRVLRETKVGPQCISYSTISAVQDNCRDELVLLRK